MIQENEEDNALEMRTVEISDLLGEKEHLYQKILYLVMADSAYCEGGFLPLFSRNVFYSGVYSNKQNVRQSQSNQELFDLAKHGRKYRQKLIITINDFFTYL